MIKVAIVEDEQKYCDELSGYLRQYAKEKQILMEIVCFSNGMAFIEYIDTHPKRFDLVFMDIKMPHVNGLSAAKHLRELDPYVVIIFTTVMMQYATKGYEVDALDYMIKPIQYLNLSLKLDKAIARISSNQAIMTLPTGDSGMVRLKAVEIYYVESMDHYCIFHTAKGEFRKIMSLSTVQSELQPEGFLRCNNSFLINPLYVTGMTKASILIKGAEIPISRRKRKEFMQEIAKYF